MHAQRMEPLATPRKPNISSESLGKLRPTVTESLGRIPLAGSWSRGPVYHRLDSDFLAQPEIPKPPATPRMQIAQVDGALRVVDRFAHAATDPVEAAAGAGLEPHATTLPGMRAGASQPRYRTERAYRVFALALGFGAGIVAAALLRLL